MKKTRSKAPGVAGHQECLALPGGENVRTLRELWPERPRAMIIGLNPAPISVDAGHYYQGGAGRRQMNRLVDAGFFGDISEHEHLDDAALTTDIGFADLVRRPTPSEAGVTPEEILSGAERIRSELNRRQVPLVISVFRHPAVALSGLPQKLVKPGRVPDSEFLPYTTVFRMPGPYAPASAVAQCLQELRSLLEAAPHPR